MPVDIADAAGQSLAAAGSVAAALGGQVGDSMLAAARVAFVDAMRLTSLLGVVVAAAGAVVAIAFLPGGGTASEARATEV